MLVKLGVDISRLNRPIRRALRIVDEVCGKLPDEEAVLTSTYEGDHDPSSLHYCNDAIDIRSPKVNGTIIIMKIQNRLGPDFDVVISQGCIHIEYDPKG